MYYLLWNCGAVYTNEGSHRDAFSSKQHEMLHVLRGLLSRSKVRGDVRLFFVIYLYSPVVDLRVRTSYHTGLRFRTDYIIDLILAQTWLKWK